MIGIGVQPTGITPTGYGSPSQSANPSQKVLLDAAAGVSTGSRRINPVTRDYVFNSDGNIEGMNNVRQLVQLAVTNAAPQLQELEKLDAGFEKGVLSVVTTAVAPLVAQGIIEVVGVSVRTNEEGGLKPGQAVTVFKWRDRTNNEEISETI